MIKLTTCATSFEAQLIKGQLETAGIHCHVTNENMSTLYSGITATFTQVDVYVNENDIEQAQAIIAPEEQN
ncbi:MAG: DUF2007 domain-containing protein [Bacteroidaceae bacterium]|nr:DUF2007 domain-containing protein [Bacteroidaceae bacterium]